MVQRKSGYVARKKAYEEIKSKNGTGGNKMTLQEAIEHCEEKAQGCSECADEHRQLAEWLKELMERRVAAAKYFGISIDEFDK